MTVLDEPWQRAAARFDFQLSYRRDLTRRIARHGSELEGEDIDNAYQVGTRSAGTWEDHDRPPEGDDTEEWWLRKYVGMALNEAIHEGLEFLVVDGKRWLNPHGAAELAIYRAVGRFVDDFAALHANPDHESRQ